MVKLNKITSILLLTLGISMFCSCSPQEDTFNDLTSGAGEKHTCKLELNITKTEYDKNLKSDTESDWKEGDKIYISFTVDGGITCGEAVYSNGVWGVSYYGALTKDVSTKCVAVYFDNSDYSTNSFVKLTENTAIYEDAEGSYVFKDGVLSVTADLTPKTGRIRFAGTDNDKIKIYGIKTYSSYDSYSGKYTESSTMLTLTVSNGYTPYIYGEFTDATQPRLNIITSNSAYTRVLPTTIFNKGESGYMTIPTETSHNGWMNSVIFKVNGVEFAMIPVVYSSGNFLLAETETTNELYNAVMGTTKSYPKRPVSLISVSNMDSFISKLNTLTGLSFSYPSFEKWIYAAKGGNKSKGYTYSGSNNIDEVAWCSSNSSSALHDVRQKLPNELGFYDMSGNVSEYIGYYSYSSSYYYFFAGGDYFSTSSYCKLYSSYSSYTYISSSTTSYADIGLRLYLSLK